MSFHSRVLLRERTGAEPLHSGAALQRKSALSQDTVNNGEDNLYSINNALGSTGRSLDTATRTFMESGFNHDFSRVQLHTGSLAAQSAEDINARAYTVRNDIVFGQGQYQPDKKGGMRLMAHELAHVVQQGQAGNSTEPEVRADEAAERVTHDQAVTPGVIGGALPGLYADNGEGEGTETPTSSPTPTDVTQPTFSVGWDVLAQLGTFRLTPPSLLMPPPRRVSLGIPPLSSPMLPPSMPSLPPPALLPPAPTPGTVPSTTPSPGTSGQTSEPPSRIPIPGAASGSFSLGLRLGFPQLEQQSIPGMPESPLAASLHSAEIMNYALTGQAPSGWDAVDKGELARYVWGIFSENIAPGLAQDITSSLSIPPGPGGLSYELDLVLISDFSSEIGGGLSFTVRYPSLESLFTGR
jgi:hypothetical protein